MKYTKIIIMRKLLTKTHTLLALMAIAIVVTLSSFINPQTEYVKVEVYNSCSEDIRVNYGITCNGANMSKTAYAKKRTSFSVPKGGCLRYRGNGGSGQRIILGMAEYDGQVFNVVDCEGY